MLYPRKPIERDAFDLSNLFWSRGLKCRKPTRWGKPNIADKAACVEVAVLNPKMVHHFARTLQRSKTDSADAQSLAEYSRRMPFTP